MKKGRGCNLAAGIIDIVLASIFIIVGLYNIVIAIDFVSSEEILAELGSVFNVVGMVALLFGATYLIFGIFTIKYVNLDVNDYYKKKNVLLVFSIIESVNAVFLPSIILHWIGYGLMVKGSEENSELSDGSEDLKASKQSVFDEEIYKKLTNLNELKQNGIINDEEFQTMKDKILKKNKICSII